MSSGSEFHKSQFILWGSVIDFFFYRLLLFLLPSLPCQPSSTWIELFDLRVAIPKEKRILLPSFHTTLSPSAQDTCVLLAVDRSVRKELVLLGLPEPD